jgi:hypothetical protein
VKIIQVRAYWKKNWFKHKFFMSQSWAFKVNKTARNKLWLSYSGYVMFSVHFLPFYILTIIKNPKLCLLSLASFFLLASIYTTKKNRKRKLFRDLEFEKEKNKLPNMRLSSCIIFSLSFFLYTCVWYIIIARLRILELVLLRVFTFYIHDQHQ